MLEVRCFHNLLVGDWLSVWSDQAGRFSDFLAPVTRQILEEQILGNILFDPEGLLLAYLDGVPVGTIHAAFGPNADGSDFSRQIGILYAPIIRSDVPLDRSGVAAALIQAGETYFRRNGTHRWYAGGYSKASPFYTGLYGWTNPEGICDADRETLEVFCRLGYSRFGVSHRYRLRCAPWKSSLTPKIQQVDGRVLVTHFERVTEPSWWEANIYRNFDTEEWNVFPRNGFNDEPIAGAVLRWMSPTFSPYGEIERKDPRYILDYIAVNEAHLREGIASFLLTVVLAGLARHHSAFTLDTVIDARNGRLASFLQANRFQNIGSVTSFYKVVA